MVNPLCDLWMCLCASVALSKSGYMSQVFGTVGVGSLLGIQQCPDVVAHVTAEHLLHTVFPMNRLLIHNREVGKLRPRDDLWVF